MGSGLLLASGEWKHVVRLTNERVTVVMGSLQLTIGGVEFIAEPTLPESASDWPSKSGSVLGGEGIFATSKSRRLTKVVS